MPEPKMKHLLIPALLLLSISPNLHAQLPEQRAQVPEQRPQAKLNMDDVLRSVDKFTSAYIQGVTERQKNGVFPLTPSDTKNMQGILEQMIRGLGSVDERENISAQGLNPDSQETLRAALECARCGRDPEIVKMKSLPETVKDLKNLLISRCKAIISIINSAKPPLSRDIVLLIEVHVSYLRQITIAYTTPPRA
jgi:hypothetical protein